MGHRLGWNTSAWGSANPFAECFFGLSRRPDAEEAICVARMRFCAKYCAPLFFASAVQIAGVPWQPVMAGSHWLIHVLLVGFVLTMLFQAWVLMQAAAESAATKRRTHLHSAILTSLVGQVCGSCLWCVAPDELRPELAPIRTAVVGAATYPPFLIVVFRQLPIHLCFLTVGLPGLLLCQGTYGYIQSSGSVGNIGPVGVLLFAGIFVTAMSVAMVRLGSWVQPELEAQRCLACHASASLRPWEAVGIGVQAETSTGVPPVHAETQTTSTGTIPKPAVTFSEDVAWKCRCERRKRRHVANRQEVEAIPENPRYLLDGLEDRLRILETDWTQAQPPDPIPRRSMICSSWTL